MRDWRRSEDATQDTEINHGREAVGETCSIHRRNCSELDWVHRETRCRRLMPIDSLMSRQIRGRSIAPRFEERLGRIRRGVAFR